MPTPNIEPISRYLLLISEIESKPMLPQISARECTIFRLVLAAIVGNKKATAKQVIEYQEKVKFPHSTPSV